MSAEKKEIRLIDTMKESINHFFVGKSDVVEKILIWGKENGYQFLALDMTSPTAHHGVNN